MATRNSQVSILKTQSRERNSQLPVPVVNTTLKTRRKTTTAHKTDTNLASPSPAISSTTVKGKKKKEDSLTTVTTMENPSELPQPLPHAEHDTAINRETEPHEDSPTPSQETIPAETTNNEKDQPPGFNLPPSTPEDPWHLAYTELRAMGKRMAQLDKIERDVTSLKTQMETVSKRTEQLENVVRNHTSDINSVKSDIAGIKSSIEKQNESVEQLWNYAEELAAKTDQRVRELKQAIQENINKIGQFANIKKDIRNEVATMIRDSPQIIKNELKKELGEQVRKHSQATKDDVNNILNRHAHDIAYKGLQDQAYFNRHNLVLLGVKEHDQDSAYSQASNFFRSDLKLSNLSIDVAYRMGKQPAQGSSYSRPILVKFAKISNRNSVWKKRKDVPRGEHSNSIRIQADLPKQLREDLQILYRVQRAALKSPQYQTAEVKNYKLYLDGEDFSAWELEELPLFLRPSTLATRRSDDTVVFYSKHSPLSNHHPSPFEVRGRSYANMEQYLAYKKAKLSGQKIFINKALLAQDPVEAKSILNALKMDHPEEWKKELSTIATEGLQAKFRQNASLGEYLRSTAPLTLGEASKNPKWGVGFTLEEEDVLNKSKWNKEGNLLGRLLMKVRNQMIHE